MLRKFAGAILIALCAAAAACGGVTDPSQNTTDVTPAGPQLLAVGAGHFVEWTFHVSNRGEVSITVTNLTPVTPSSSYFLVGLGLNVSGQCSPLQENQFSVVGSAAISGYSVQPGDYCAYVEDEGLFTVSETVTILVSHP